MSNIVDGNIEKKERENILPFFFYFLNISITNEVGGIGLLY